MTNTGSHPAVFAGLLGGASWGVPTWAYAISLDQVSLAASNSLVVQFLLGCMTGAAVAGAAIGATSLVRQRRERAEQDAEQRPETPEDPAVPVILNAEESPWSSSSLSLVRAQLQAEEDDPTDSLKRMRTGQISLDAVDRALELSQASAEPETPRRGRHAATDPTDAGVRAVARRSGRHFATSEVASDEDVARPKHAAPRVSAEERPLRKHAAPQPVEQAPVAAAPEPFASVAPSVPAPPVGLPVAATPRLGIAARAALADLPTIDSRRSLLEAATTGVETDVTNVLPRRHAEYRPVVSSLPATPQHVLATDDPFVAADNHKTLRNLLAERTKGVRTELAERLSPEAMESIPQIQRADGSVDEITPTWFDHNVVPALATLVAKIDDLDELDDTAPLDPGAYERKMRVSTAPTFLMPGSGSGVVPTPAPAESGSLDLTIPLSRDHGATRASIISTRIADVDLGIFPERRSAEALEHEDVFEQALAAMGENMHQDAPVFEDMVGGPATIDDPDGLEGPTTLIPFRTRRASVVDPATYVDFLIDDELSRGKRDTGIIRRQPKHAYLRVLEGGTSPMRLQQLADGSGRSATSYGRHFAPHYDAKAL